MLSVEDAQKRLLSMIRTVDESELIPVSEALGRSPADSITAPIDLPPFDCSAMDGYAISGNNPFEAGKNFEVVGESLAGHPYTKKLDPEQACRILTGAAIPPGTTAIAIQEDTLRKGNSVMLCDTVQAGDNIRRKGMDIAAGKRIVNTGEYLSPFAIGWFAACGISEVEVVRKVRIAIFSTGDELQDPGTDLQYGQIYESNRMSLSMLLKSKPVEVVDLGHLKDDKTEIRSAIDGVADEVDLIVASGGVSVGDTDLVRPVIEEAGNLSFWKLALKPGKPLAVGNVNGSLFFGLPGNPVSTIITYLLFVAPTIDALSGLPWRKPTQFQATLSAGIRHRQGRREYQRGILISREGDSYVTPTGDQSSNRLASFYQCNCLIEIPSHRGALRQGESVNIWLLPGLNTFV